MTDGNDPPRFRDSASDAPERLRELFAAATLDQPTAAERARLEAKLAPLLRAPDAPNALDTPNAPEAPGPASVALKPLAKVALGVVALGAVGTALWFAAARSSGDGHGPDSVTPPSASVPSSPVPLISATATAAAPAPGAATATGASSADPLATSPLTTPISTGSASGGSATSPRPSGLPEDQLLEQARSALRSNPTRALALTREHQSRFPGGVLTQEREVIAIEALRKLGRTQEAEQRTQRFERRYPESAHKRSLSTPTNER